MTFNLDDVHGIDRASVERRTKRAVMDPYPAQPVVVRSVDREPRRVAAAPFGASFRDREYRVHDYVVYAELYRILGPAKIGHALDLLAIQVDRAIDVCRDPTSEALAFEAHDLCGSAGMLGFMDLGAVSRRLQTVLAGGTPDGHEYDVAFNAFVVALGRAKRILSALRAAIATDFAYRIYCDRFDREDMSSAGLASRYASDDLGHLA